MNFPTTLIAIFAVIPFFNSHVNGDIVSTSFRGDVMAEFDGDIDVVGSSQQAANTNAFVGEDNSHTQSDLGWRWEGSPARGELIGESSLVSAMVDGDGAGGSHQASSNFSFEFTVDTVSDVSFSGNLSIEGISAQADSVGFSFESESTTLYSEFNASDGGSASGSFSYSNRIDAGTYTMKFDAELFELIETPETTDIGWKLDGFVISVVVPEPSAASLLLIGLLLAAMSRGVCR